MSTHIGIRREMISMPRNSFIQMNKLTNVSGRITYISSKAKQENLYATYTIQFPREIFSGNWQSVIRKALFKVGQMENVLRQGN